MGDAALARVAARLVAACLALVLAACGPGTGGTGLPPGDGTPTASTGTAPSSTAPSSTVPSSTAPALVAPLPDRAPDLAGPIESADADALTIAGTRLPRASVSLRDAAGAPLADDAAQAGRPARAWRAGEGWLVALGG
ncbi:MAG: hypothetical protein RJA99_1743 [Pseudomonadota bacterium]|jgi:hypothetical protein